METALTASPPGLAILAAEHRIVDEAIACVASGRSRRVVVAGLPDVPRFLDAVRRSADAAGVRLVTLVGSSDMIVDLAVEAVWP